MMTLFWISVAVGMTLMALILALAVADGFYRSRYRWTKRVANIGGRRGLIVSHWPLDLRVTINALMTEDEFCQAFDKSSGWTWGEWKQSGERRIWITAWRWNAILEKPTFSEVRG